MPMRSSAMQRPRRATASMTLRHRYDEVGLPCWKMMGSPSPISTYAIDLPRTETAFFGCSAAPDMCCLRECVTQEKKW